jgi:membrane protein implicated in regulation of membrane protease activity
VIFYLLAMNWDIFSVDSVFLICMLLGLGYSLLQMVLGGGHGGGIFGGLDVDVGNVDIGFGGHDIVDVQDVHLHGGGGGADAGAGPSVFNMITVSNFLASFGAIGLIARIGFQASPLVSILVTTPISLSIAYSIFWFLYRFLFAQQGSSMVSHSEIKGLTAEVITPVPADGYGEIAYILHNSRMTSPAKSLNKKPVGKGELVQIVSMAGNTAFVKIYEEVIEEEQKSLEDKRLEE